MTRGNGGGNMKNPLESLSTTVGLGVVLTAIMVLIIAIFYWDTGEAEAPDTSEPPASEEGATPPEDASDTGAAGDAGGGDASTTETGN
jgi:hypothetical protein